MGVQLVVGRSVAELHECHANTMLGVGVPLHVPSVAVNVDPTFKAPEISGRVRFDGPSKFNLKVIPMNVLLRPAAPIADPPIVASIVVPSALADWNLICSNGIPFVSQSIDLNGVLAHVLPLRS